MKKKFLFQSKKLTGARPVAPLASSSQDEADPRPSHDEVARRAYFIYLNQRCPQGQDVEHWLEAEAQPASGSPEDTLR
jgi:hypothetical protein